MNQQQAVVFGLGGNLGPVRENLKQALEMIAKKLGPSLAVSTFVESEPWGYSSPNVFVNAIAVFFPVVPIESCLELAQQIEQHFGRTRIAGGYSDRPMDVDLVDYCGYTINEPHLQLPHPRMHQRLFVLEPLAEVFPNWTHPVLGKSVHELIKALRS